MITTNNIHHVGKIYYDNEGNRPSTNRAVDQEPLPINYSRIEEFISEQFEILRNKKSESTKKEFESLKSEVESIRNLVATISELLHHQDKKHLREDDETVASSRSTFHDVTTLSAEPVKISSPSLNCTSESVHCNPLTQFNTVSSGFSCHTGGDLSRRKDNIASSSDNCWKDNTTFSSRFSCNANGARSMIIPSFPTISLNEKKKFVSSRQENNITKVSHKSRQSKCWIHVFSKTTSTTSLRTKCAAAAAEVVDVQSPRVYHRRNRRLHKKLQKIHHHMHFINVPTCQFKLTKKDIESEIVVVDGGNSNAPPIKPPSGIKWRRIHVKSFHIEDECRPNIGLVHPKIDGIFPIIRLPRQMSLNIIGNCDLQKIYNSLTVCEKLRHSPLFRGKSKQVFTDYGKPIRYTVVGVQPSRNSKEVKNHPSFMDSLHDSHWRTLVWMMKCAEESFRQFGEHLVLSNLFHARKLVPFKTFTSPTTNYTSDYFGAIGYGNNVFLRCHTDEDFTMSIIQVFLKGLTHYNVHDDIIVFFCLPTLGVAVPLRPGDYLIFNPRLPHCISSRCAIEHEVISISAYLKSSIVGMNNNDLPLTQDQLDIISKLKQERCD